MASSPANQSAGKGKQMSSRLATMKFMQRAAASAPTSPSTPTGKIRSDSSIPNSPLDDGPPSKRLKSSRLSGAQDILEPSSPARYSAGGKEVSQQAGSLQLGDGTETKWAFAVRHDTVVPKAGFRIEVLSSRHSDVSDDEDSGRLRADKSQGRMVFGRKQKHTPSKQGTADKEESDGSSDSDSSGSSLDSLDRQARKILDGPESWKGGPAAVTRSNRISGATNMDRMQCHGCKGFGHMLRNCPNREARRQYHPMGVGQRG